MSGLARPGFAGRLRTLALAVAAGCSGSTAVGPGTGGQSGSTGGATGVGGTSGGAGGTSGAAGSTGRAGTSGGAGTSGLAGTTGGAGSSGSAGSGGTVPAACATDLASRVRITEIDVGTTYAYNEVDNNGAALGLTPLAISPIPGGGSRLVFLGKGDGMAHVVTLDAGDQVTGSFALAAYDVQDIYADATGGVLLVSRAAMGGTAADNNCGDITHLCGLTTAYPTTASCYDMYMVRFDGTTETWATKLTDTSPTLPAYGTSATTGTNVIYIWSEYAHNGRIAFDGANYAGYFGAAITVPGQMCVGSSTLANGVNIHQGDRMKIVDGAGALQSGGFDWGCSHSGFERVVYDPAARKFVGVCKNDAATGSKSGRLAFPPSTTIVPVDLSYSDLGSVVNAGGGGYWIASTDARPGQPANTNGLADVHLYHVAGTSTPTPDMDLIAPAGSQNDRAPHLAGYGSGLMLAAWETSTATGDLAQNDPARQMWLAVLDATTGVAPAGSTAASAGPLSLSPNVLGSRYQDFRAYPDGSVAYPAPGTSNSKIKILRVLGCQ